MGREQVHPDPAGDVPAGSAAPRGIVVGVDGSDHSKCALVWAAREAERRRRPLHIVTAYSVPIFAASGLDGGYATVDDSVIREGAEAILRQAVNKVAGYLIDVDASVENGDASGVLLEMSETAELLVFGTRGRGGFVGRLLGSVQSEGGGAVPLFRYGQTGTAASSLLGMCFAKCRRFPPRRRCVCAQ